MTGKSGPKSLSMPSIQKPKRDVANMKKTVDSTKQKLTPPEIMLNAKDSTGALDEYDAKVSMPAMITEFSQPNTQVEQFGNALYVVHGDDDGDGFFKFFTADEPKNELDNFISFIIWAKNNVGMKHLLTELKDEKYLRLFDEMYANAPFQNMGYNIYAPKDGKTRVLLNLGKGEA